MTMQNRRWMLPLGIFAVASFTAFTVFGQLGWTGYSAVRDYLSALISRQAPHAGLNRTLFNLYTISFCVYSLAMTVYSFLHYRRCCRAGYGVLFFLAFFAVPGYGAVPIGADVIFWADDLLHLVFTIGNLTLIVAAMGLITYGYRVQEQAKALGRISLVATILFVAFNLWHIAAILTGQNILGLLQRLTLFSFHAFTLLTSWICTKGAYHRRTG